VTTLPVSPVNSSILALFGGGALTTRRVYAPLTWKAYGADLRTLLDILGEGKELDLAREGAAFAARQEWGRNRKLNPTLPPPTPTGTAVDRFFVLDSIGVQDLIQKLLEKGYKVSTVRRKVAALRSIWKALLAAGMVEGSPFKGVKSVKSVANDIKVFDPAVWLDLTETTAESHLQRCRRSLSGPQRQTLQEMLDRRDLAMLFLCCLEGVRTGELAALSEGDYTASPATLRVSSGGRTRTLKLKPVTADALSGYINSLYRVRPSTTSSGAIIVKEVGRKLFANKHLRDLSSRSIRRKLQSLLKRLGLDRVSPSALRHMAIIEALASEGLSANEAAARFGVRSSSTLFRHLRLAPDWRQALERVRASRATSAGTQRGTAEAGASSSPKPTAVERGTPLPSVTRSPSTPTSRSPLPLVSSVTPGGSMATATPVQAPSGPPRPRATSLLPRSDSGT
jgi:integrase